MSLFSLSLLFHFCQPLALNLSLPAALVKRVWREVEISRLIWGAGKAHACFSGAVTWLLIVPVRIPNCSYQTREGSAWKASRLSFSTDYSGLFWARDESDRHEDGALFRSGAWGKSDPDEAELGGGLHMDTKLKTSQSAILIMLRLSDCCLFGWQSQGKRRSEIVCGLDLCPGKEKILTMYQEIWKMEGAAPTLVFSHFLPPFVFPFHFDFFFEV